jgi:ribonuclease-3
MAHVAQAPTAMSELEARLQYVFRDRSWLHQALTHRSLRVQEESGRTGPDNERLEFLGDAILGFLVSDALYNLFPNLREGKLSRIRANLVNRRSLCRIAERLELGQFLHLGPGEEKTGGRQKEAILANAVEALLAAIYCDGGLAAAQRFLEEFLLKELPERDLQTLVRSDHKSALQEHLQGRGMPSARYELKEERGPEHRKSFMIEVWVGERTLARGEGASKKAAEQQAARRALRQLQAEEEAGSSE